MVNILTCKWEKSPIFEITDFLKISSPRKLKPNKRGIFLIINDRTCIICARDLINNGSLYRQKIKTASKITLGVCVVLGNNGRYLVLTDFGSRKLILEN